MLQIVNLIRGFLCIVNAKKYHPINRNLNIISRYDSLRLDIDDLLLSGKCRPDLINKRHDNIQATMQDSVEAAQSFNDLNFRLRNNTNGLCEGDDNQTGHNARNDERDIHNQCFPFGVFESKPSYSKNLKCKRQTTPVF